MIGIVDYGMGNLWSVKKKLDNLGVNNIISSVKEGLENCNKLILPGVGHFKQATEEIKTRGLWEFLNHFVLVDKKPILGICLGMQLMVEKSEEGNSSGFGWINGEVKRFEIKDKLRYKIPHIGWNTLKLNNHLSILDNVNESDEFYFVHSFHCCNINSADVIATTEYEYNFTSAFSRDNIFGMQFHPEKSHGAGEKILRNFANI